MSSDQEVAPARNKQTLSEEYSKLCTAAGDLQYRIQILSEDLVVVNAELKKLNQEAAALVKDTSDVAP